MIVEMYSWTISEVRIWILENFSYGGGGGAEDKMKHYIIPACNMYIEIYVFKGAEYESSTKLYFGRKGVGRAESEIF